MSTRIEAMTHEKISAQMQPFIDCLPVALLIIDELGRIVVANVPAVRLFGYSAQELVGAEVERLVPVSARQAHPGLRSQYLQAPRARAMGTGRELYAAHKDGQLIPVEIGLNPYQSDQGRFVLASVIDISERVQAETALRELNQALEQRVTERTQALTDANAQLMQSLTELQDTQAKLVQSEKMAAIGGLVAGVAHEINTPVGVSVTAASHLDQLVGRYQSLYREGALKRSDFEDFLKDSREAAEMILANLLRAAELIASFKRVAVDQSSDAQRDFRVCGYIADILLSLKPRLKSSPHSIAVDCAEELVVRSYPGAFSQILTNLVMNSITHAFDAVPAGQMTISVSQQGRDLLLRYRDNGCGVTDEARGKLFDPFYTTKRGQGGSGLGLHIIYNLVTQTLGGRIECYSEPGQGIGFEIVVPDCVIAPV